MNNAFYLFFFLSFIFLYVSSSYILEISFRLLHTLLIFLLLSSTYKYHINGWYFFKKKIIIFIFQSLKLSSRISLLVCIYLTILALPAIESHLRSKPTQYDQLLMNGVTSTLVQSRNSLSNKISIWISSNWIQSNWSISFFLLLFWDNIYGHPLETYHTLQLELLHSTWPSL